MLRFEDETSNQLTVGVTPDELMKRLNESTRLEFMEVWKGGGTILKSSARVMVVIVPQQLCSGNIPEQKKKT